MPSIVTGRAPLSGLHSGVPDDGGLHRGPPPHVLALAAAGLGAVYIAYRNEKHGGALMVGVAVVTVLYVLLFGN